MRAVAGIAIVIGLSACSVSWDDKDKDPGVTGTGSGTTRSYAVADFSGVTLKGPDNVDVRVGAGYSVRAEGPSGELDRLRIARDGDTLSVGRRNGMSWGHHDPVTIHVTMPRLTEAAVVGSGDMRIDRVEGSGFDASLSGSGNIGVGAAAVERMGVNIAGSGALSASGTARQLDVDIAGSGDMRAKGLRATQASVRVAGSGSVTATVAGPASVDMLGSGDVDLGGAADCTVKKMGSGSVRCR